MRNNELEIERNSLLKMNKQMNELIKKNNETMNSNSADIIQYKLE